MTSHIRRRSLLRGGAWTAAALAASPALLAACGNDTEPSATGPSGPPKAGGTLRAAFVGAGASETLSYFHGGTNLDFVRARAMHATLGNLDPSAPDGVRYEVLDGIDVSPDLTSYTLRIRPGLTFSDGSPLTARDVLYSLITPFQDAKSLAVYKTPGRNFDLAKAEVKDPLTLILPTLRPIADGRLVLCQGNYLVLKEGSRFEQAAPTSGPFRLTTFEAGQGAALVRNDAFTLHEVLLDGLELRNIADSDARAAALTGGQIDFAGDLAPITARNLDGSGTVTVTRSEAPYVSGLFFRLNMTQKPFDDPRVRTAFKLAANRQAMLDTALHGQGLIGNDLLSPGFPGYAEDIAQRPYDPEAARALLAEAGAQNLEVTLTTGPETPGMVEVATLYVENLTQIGVKATLRELPAGQLFADFPAYVKLPFAASFSVPVPPMPLYQSSYGGKNPSALGWNRPDVDAEVTKARAAADPAAAATAAATAQRAMWTDGNTVAPVFKPFITAAVPGVRGVADDLFAQFPGFSRASLR
ncbi:ABC transporter substrate-binding protein [Catenuloplanes indicus]|uniref:Peptide/nickel transport system substrate-binding protein n=1 Tax=Catenuloplanes indicus TaxID=137267 RepID=A0AAE3VTH0_9ACTN|nr:ABC transporter substrate-binding protein [Catenuloplanes indicus]MDQ0363546.1 peptide/nickel transport system substrate-binding protein [Catenuloplanes indicus]